VLKISTVSTGLYNLKYKLTLHLEVYHCHLKNYHQTSAVEPKDENVVQFKPRLRPRDTVDAAIADGTPLPLEIMLENLRYWNNMAKELTSHLDPEAQAYARSCSRQCTTRC
jgi:hypothetical protein